MPETLQDFELARTERLWDGAMLGWGGRHEGGLYLLGYHAEMTLKCAYFRFRGLQLPDPIRRNQELQTAAGRARQLGVAWPPEGYHSLRFWRDLLIADRLDHARPLPGPLILDLTAHVDALYNIWRVEMRYRAPAATAFDLEQAVVAADWLDTNYITLYA